MCMSLRVCVCDIMISLSYASFTSVLRFVYLPPSPLSINPPLSNFLSLPQMVLECGGDIDSVDGEGRCGTFMASLKGDLGQQECVLELMRQVWRGRGRERDWVETEHIRGNVCVRASVRVRWEGKKKFMLDNREGIWDYRLTNTNGQSCTQLPTVGGLSLSYTHA